MAKANVSAAVLSLCLISGTAWAVPITFIEITGLAGGSPAATGVFRADLSGLAIGQIASVTIQDNSATSAGATGQFSGFDLDAIVLSSTLVNDASQVGTLNRIATFNFATSLFTPGAQTPPTDPRLFGTNASGQVDQSVATLNAFDGNSTTAIPGAFGFVSLGVGGKLQINLTTPISTGSPEYLYIGEVGNNGEVAASSITVSATPIGVPEPASLALLGLGIFGLGCARGHRAWRG